MLKMPFPNIFCRCNIQLREQRKGQTVLAFTKTTLRHSKRFAKHPLLDDPGLGGGGGGVLQNGNYGR